MSDDKMACLNGKRKANGRVDGFNVSNCGGGHICEKLGRLIEIQLHRLKKAIGNKVT